MTTLDDLLALLPDNTTGEISAADLRTVVTGLWNHGWIGNSYAYSWTTSTSALPVSGRLNVDWAVGTGVLHISQQDAGSVRSPESVFGTAGGKLQLVLNAGGAVVVDLTCVGTFTDQGNWYDVDVTVDSVTGSAPSNNTAMTLRSLMEKLP